MSAGAFADLRVRAISGAALALAAGAALWLGGWAFAGLMAAAAAAMVWELRRMLAGRFDAAGALGAAAAAGAVLATQATQMRWGVAALLLGALAAYLADRRTAGWRRAAFALGAGYVGLACAAYDGLRDDPLYGAAAALWVWLTVIASDVGGYFGGRMIGGPRLWPAVSPNKTWAGLAGGVALASAAGAAFSAMTTGTLAHEVMLVSAALAVVSQGGDIAESRLKRACGVKDSSALIPGHGGVLDRMDGLLAAALAAALITFWRGRSVFVW
ncbi:phosphatidate cytidylyltransferase [Oceanicella actignis]|uniref:Phosphatidate cytidylyltransferase n=1 Tax=Oceanicella actignis TaxID=1189325 RepID=A0A1M7U0K0_9RHOB|nr:phosphatidate cytidylyltransferase [Oceanicella actignis]SET84463.1 phosphatidate cytidylyltransferase [Oceanicella actignis]SHN76485.1 phosphatidate cytidylyltransferase [Oceanicella actignis]